MPSAARNLANLLGGSSTIPVEKLSSDLSTIEQVSSTNALTASGNVVGDQRVVGNNLYIWNGTGWYRIALINQTPTWDSGGQPSASYILDADSPQDATVITLAASDPDGLPISYSYVTSGSMDSMATIIQDSSVFTITPKTVEQVGEGVELTGSITFRASDGVNILPSVSSFTLNFITIIENSKYTTLLATAVDTSDNNNITDASSNNHTITVTGDAYAGTFSPYRHGGYSFFTSGGDANYLSIPGDTSLDIYDGDYTVEAWLYPTTFNSTQCHWLSKGGNSTREWSFNVTSDGLDVYWSTNGSNTGDSGVFISSTTNNLREWAHWCITKSGNTITVYKNGTSIGTGTFTSVYTNNGTLKIGRFMDYTGISHSYAGYISDLRIVKGAAIAPPSGGQTERLTTSVSGGTVSLLTCHLPYIVDGSTNNHAITLNGSTSTKPFGPYDHNEYSESTNGGSVYFDGSGDDLTIADHTSFDFGTNDFTVETWFYLASDDGTYTICAQHASGITGGIWLGRWANGFVFRRSSIADVITASAPPSANEWHHVAVSRSSGSTRMFIDGTQVGSTVTSDTNNYSVSAPISIGYDGNTTIDEQRFNGYISDFRIVKGTGLYTSDFTPPTAPLTAITNTSLLISGTDASIIDKSQGSNLKLVGNTTGSTTQVKFAGSKSIYFDDAGDYITSTVIPPGTGDFTCEAWVRFDNITSGSGNNQIICSFGSYAPSLYYRSASNEIALYHGSVFYLTGFAPSSNTWYHMAMAREGTSMRVFIDGTQYGTTQTYSTDVTNTELRIGWDGVDVFGGYIQDFRYTKDLARYTANFTPPTEPFKG